MIINPKKAREEIYGYLVSRTGIHDEVMRELAKAKLMRIHATLGRDDPPDEARSRFAGRQAEAADDGKPGGHPSYSTVAYSRLSPSFVRMVSYAVDSGDAVFTEAFRLMGVKSIGVYETLCKMVQAQQASVC